jgi:hydrogenase nickel incorporation protein HypA/HybF
MHELSLAHSIIEIAKQYLQDAPSCTVRSIRVKVGALSCVNGESLTFSFNLMAVDTAVQGAKLVIEELPLVIFCSVCNQTRQLPGIQGLQCPNCGTITSDIRQGNELEVDSLEVEENPTGDP